MHPTPSCSSNGENSLEQVRGRVQKFLHEELQKLESKEDQLLFLEYLGEVVRNFCEHVFKRDLEDEEIKKLIEVAQAKEGS